MIEPFFFGQRGALAFYHPSSDPGATRLVVICPPFFDEYRRTYRALSDLATACAANGVHVIRIDYSGTGESQGLLSDIRDMEWLDDINAAIEEGIGLTGAESVILVGVRFGATLAAQLTHSAIRRYVFWDPVDEGQNYVAWLDSLENRSRKKHLTISKHVNRRPEEISFAYFPLNDSLVRTISTFKTDALLSKGGDNVWVVSTDDHFCKQSRYQHCEYAGYGYDWPPYHDGMLTPKPVLERIAKAVLMA